MHPATLIFALTYILISLGENSPRKLDRPTAALLGAVLMIASGVLSRADAAAAMDLSTLAILFGMMVLLSVLRQSGLPTFLVRKALDRCRNARGLLALIVFVSGGASAILLNDTVCLLATPLLVQLSLETGLPATPLLIALATSANIGSVMTITGNPQNIIIAHASGWGWTPFALRMIPIGVVCLAVNWLLLILLYRRAIPTGPLTPHPSPLMPISHRGSAWKSVSALAVLIAAFLAGVPLDFAAVATAVLLLVWLNKPPREALRGVDWTLLLFFAGLFIVVSGFVRENRVVVDAWIRSFGAEIRLDNIVQITLASVIGSNLFSNVPFVLIVGHWIPHMSNPRMVWLLLALTSTFAGNLTLFGSVANVIVAQLSGRDSPLGFLDFLKAGIPVTLLSTAVGVAMLWWFTLMGWLT
jgi:Na+/H+ antiporter NhaD/arsenite permease-like protein